MKVRENAQMRLLADNHPQALRVSFEGRVAGFRAPVCVGVRRSPFMFFIYASAPQVGTRAALEETRSLTVWNPQPRLGQRGVRPFPLEPHHARLKATTPPPFQLLRGG